MKLFKALCVILVLCLGISLQQAGAQKNFGQKADEAFDTEQYSVAIDLYKSAYQNIKRNNVERARVLFRLAECYRLTNNSRQAINWYQRVIKAGYPDPIAYLYLADAYKAEEKYPDAIIQYNEYSKMKPDDTRGKFGAQSCELAQTWKDNPTRYVVENMRRFNSRQSDFSPYWADKKYKAIVFTSTREGTIGKGSDGWTGQSFSDLFISTQDRKGAWSEPVLLDEGPVNTEYNEGTPWINERANIVYFTRCPIVKKQIVGCQIYSAKKQGRGWATPDTLNLAPNMTYAVGHPTLSEDELTIFFSSDMPGGYGGKDIWMASRTRKTRPFDKPVNLGPNINTEGDEVFPYLRDNNTLYYSSNGHSLLGMGGLDIYKVTKEGDKWGKPVNMQYPINSPGDDFGIVFMANKEEGYFSSNRRGGRGDDDIYSFYVPPLIFTLEGTIRDDSTKQVIVGALVELEGSDGTTVTDSSNELGMYRFGKTQILENTSYVLTVTKPKYYSAKGRETTVGLTDSKDLVHDFVLAPILPEPVVLPDVLYDLAKWELTPQAIDSLNWLLDILKDNPRWVIELSSHTDSRPIPMTNDTLSERRARSAADYLIKQGIEAGRIVAKGYGDHRPRVLDRDKNVYLDPDKYRACRDKPVFFPAGTKMTDAFVKSLKTTCEKEAAHQLNRRTEFLVLSEDYIPSGSDDGTTDGLRIVVNPMDNVVTVLPGAGGTFEARCIINGVSMDFKYDASEDKIQLNAEMVMRLMKDYRITVNDFKDKDKAFNQDGSIKDNAILTLKRFGIGKKSLAGVEVVVVKGIDPPVLLGSKALTRFGEYSIEEDKRQLIFDDPNAPKN
jgi:peptidoglycan-associated lipoprotein